MHECYHSIIMLRIHIMSDYNQPAGEPRARAALALRHAEPEDVALRETPLWTHPTSSSACPFGNSSKHPLDNCKSVGNRKMSPESRPTSDIRLFDSLTRDANDVIGNNYSPYADLYSRACILLPDSSLASPRNFLWSLLSLV